MPGKRLQFDAETLATLEALASDAMMDFQELADEAFRDLLRKHGRPVDLKDALKKSVVGSSAKPSKPAKARKKTSRAKNARTTER
jgi:hypothetical protein